MAYVTPTSKTTGDLIAATDWNQNTVDNSIALRTGAIAIASQAANDLISASSATQLARIASAASSFLITSASSVPSLSQTIPFNLTLTGNPATYGQEFTGSNGGGIAATHASGTIRFYSGGASEVGRWAANGDFYSVAMTDYYASSTITGWSSLIAGRRYINYKKIGKLVWVNYHLEGTSNSTAVSFTLPYAAQSQYGDFGGPAIFTYDNGSTITVAGAIRMVGGSSTVSAYTNMGSGAWTAAGTKISSGSFWYYSV